MNLGNILIFKFDNVLLNFLVFVLLFNWLDVDCLVICLVILLVILFNILFLSLLVVY